MGVNLEQGRGPHLTKHGRDVRSQGLQKFCVLSRSVVSNSLRPHELQPARLLRPWGFSRQEHWNELPFSPPGDLPDPGIEPRSPMLQADSLLSEPPRKPPVVGGGRAHMTSSGKWAVNINNVCYLVSLLD